MDHCALGEGNKWHSDFVLEEGLTMWKCSFSTQGLPGSLASELPPSGGLVTWSIAFSAGNFVGFFSPSDPLLTPRSALASSFGMPEYHLPESFILSSLRCRGVLALLASPRTEMALPAHFVQGSLPREGKAASLDLESGLEDVISL